MIKGSKDIVYRYKIYCRNKENTVVSMSSVEGLMDTKAKKLICKRLMSSDCSNFQYKVAKGELFVLVPYLILEEKVGRDVESVCHDAKIFIT